jgi:hypothetical protein
MNEAPKIPKELDDFVAKVLSYRPKQKTKAATKRNKATTALKRKKQRTSTLPPVKDAEA